MNTTAEASGSHEEKHRAAVRALDGKNVMVNPGPSSVEPPVGMRGTIRVTPSGAVEIMLRFAVMFVRPAETQTVRLDDAEVAQLLASENNGAYSITLPRALEPPPSKGFVVASPRL
jgi:hypothetical protein